jgi:hypothetical protein
MAADYRDADLYELLNSLIRPPTEAASLLVLDFLQSFLNRSFGGVGS